MATGTFKIEDMLAAIDKIGTLTPMHTLLVSPRTRASIEAAAFKCEPSAVPSNPLLSGYRTEQKLMGIGLEILDIPPEVVYDWSGCRSPARAQRRHKRGFPQRVKITHKEIAYLVDRTALRRMAAGWERHAVKMLIGQ